MSLRVLMMGVMLLGISLSIGISSWLSTHDSHRQIEELFDAQMLQSAKILEMFYGSQTLIGQDSLVNHPLLLSIKPTKVETFNEDANAQQLAYEQKLAFQIWTPEGQLLVRSANTAEQPMAEFVVGYHRKMYMGSLWHMYSYFSPRNNVWIIAGQRDDVRKELVDQIMGNSLIAPAIVFPLVSLLMIFLSYLLLEPLQTLADKLKRRDPSDLTPLHMRLPSELVTVRDAMNAYIARVAAAMSRERKFSGDAAHELKTPLAVIKLHHQGLLESDNPEELLLHHQAIDKGIEQIAHTVEQMLLLSRVESLEQLNVTEVGISELVQQVLNDMLPIIADYQWELHLPEKIMVIADPFYLKLVLKNLIDNACKYSDKAGPIKINAWEDKQHGTAVLQIQDSGPGLDEESCRQITERFFRVANENVAGSGLGLSICAQIVGLHKGKLTIKPGVPDGLDVRVILPKPVKQR
ncbi:ATP-binding protein [Shewanella sp. A32]|uniref:ATP-binding protein n=1 Tax=Shewanella sp. A32 TaxID=3031327 RepID=UPI0023B9194B|nr:ATP-binding protein [Shewanella sp. A32]MDF0534376.1 ATP-binding protein [Shewanella sp. A32]